MYWWILYIVLPAAGVCYTGFLVGVALFISRKLTMPPRQKQKKTPADYALSFEEVDLTTAKGYRIQGWVVASQEPSKGTLILCHNYKASKQKLLPWIRFLSQGGYEVVAFDFNGHGESEKAHTWWGMVEDTVLDLETVMDQLDRLPLCNACPLGLMGFSMGSVTIVGYLALHAEQNRVGAVILDSGPPSPSVWNVEADLILSPFFRKLPGIRLVRYGVRYWQSFKHLPEEVRHMPRHSLKTDAPFLFIQGLRDRICLPGASRLFYDDLSCSHKEYWAVPEAHHMTIMTLREQEYQQRVLRFLDRFLASADIPSKSNIGPQRAAAI